jgi:heme exporter protein D
MKYTLWWCVLLSTPIAIFEGAKRISSRLRIVDIPIGGYLLSNLVSKIMGDLLFPVGFILYDFAEHVLMSELPIVEATAVWYDARSFSEKLDDKYTSLLSCFVARLLIDLLHYELVAPERDYLGNHVHHLMIILVLVVFLTHLPDLYSLGLPIVLAGCSFEVGSALTYFQEIFSEIYKLEQMPVFCFVHDYGFRLSNLIGSMIFASAIWKDFRMNGVPYSPFVWFMIAMFVILVISREALFIPTSKHKKRIISKLSKRKIN